MVFVATHADRRELFLGSGRRDCHSGPNDITKTIGRRCFCLALIASKAALVKMRFPDIAYWGGLPIPLHLLDAPTKDEVISPWQISTGLSRKIPNLCKVAPGYQ